jgi:hypothetical protein
MCLMGPFLRLLQPSHFWMAPNLKPWIPLGSIKRLFIRADVATSLLGTVRIVLMVKGLLHLVENDHKTHGTALSKPRPPNYAERATVVINLYTARPLNEMKLGLYQLI